jgi:hypothetical protein
MIQPAHGVDVRDGDEIAKGRTCSIARELAQDAIRLVEKEISMHAGGLWLVK